MSDLQNRLFLGQVARSMAGMNEIMVNHDPVLKPDSELILKFGPMEKAVAPNLATESGSIRGLYVLSDSMGTHRTDELSFGRLSLFESPYSQAFGWASEEFKYQGTLRNMMKAAGQEE